MNVTFTIDAERDLEAIGDWIADRDPTAAARLVAELEHKATALGRMPFAFPVTEFGFPGEFRKRTHRRYAIIYRVAAEVEILRVVHTAQDYPALFRNP